MTQSVTQFTGFSYTISEFFGLKDQVTLISPSSPTFESGLPYLSPALRRPPGTEDFPRLSRIRNTLMHYLTQG